MTPIMNMMMMITTLSMKMQLMLKLLQQVHLLFKHLELTVAHTLDAAPRGRFHKSWVRGAWCMAWREFNFGRGANIEAFFGAERMAQK